jgi:hypothetical protein
VSPKAHIKTIAVEDVDRQQTLLIFPVDYVRRFQKPAVATFQEIARDAVAVRLAGAGERVFFKPYKLVTSHEATWASIPRPWLRNIGARVGDLLDLWTTDDPGTLLLQYRRHNLL